MVQKQVWTHKEVYNSVSILATSMDKSDTVGFPLQILSQNENSNEIELDEG